MTEDFSIHHGGKMDDFEDPKVHNLRRNVGFMLLSTCSDCLGTGGSYVRPTYVYEACKRCEGTGRIDDKGQKKEER